MAASLALTVVNAAPGNTLILQGSGLLGGAGASVNLSNQGVLAQPNLAPTTITLPAVFAGDGSSVTISPVPDGINSGTLTVTASDATTATCALRAWSQYAQASEYIGEGVDVSGLAPGELDRVLQRASAYADAYMNHSLRQLQVLERHPYREQRDDKAPRVYPYRVRGRLMPIISIDQLTFVSAQDLVTVFNPQDMYLNSDLGYLEVLAYAIGNYALLGALQVIGYSANVFELTFTSGYPVATYPQNVVEATCMIATELLYRRNLSQLGVGGMKSLNGNTIVLDGKDFQIPAPAKRLLAPFVTWGAA